MGEEVGAVTKRTGAQNMSAGEGSGGSFLSSSTLKPPMQPLFVSGSFGRCWRGCVVRVRFLLAQSVSMSFTAAMSRKPSTHSASLIALSLGTAISLGMISSSATKRNVPAEKDWKHAETVTSVGPDSKKDSARPNIVPAGVIALNKIRQLNAMRRLARAFTRLTPRAKPAENKNNPKSQRKRSGQFISLPVLCCFLTVWLFCL